MARYSLLSDQAICLRRQRQHGEPGKAKTPQRNFVGFARTGFESFVGASFDRFLEQKDSVVCRARTGHYEQTNCDASNKPTRFLNVPLSKECIKRKTKKLI